MRLQKYLAECGIASRREAEKLIEGGRVQVNGQAAALGESVDPAKDTITFDGTPVEHDTPTYIVLYKPKGVVTTAKDTHRRKTVMDFLSGVTARVFPVGRLDMDVEGAVILTNDGELAYRLMHPKFEIDKVYLACVQGCMTPEEAARLAHGVELDDGTTAPARVRILGAHPAHTRIEITLHEGRKREVKRMCAAVGHPVVHLRRESTGGVHVRDLRPGEWRYLDPGEITALRGLAGL